MFNSIIEVPTHKKTRVILLTSGFRHTYSMMWSMTSMVWQSMATVAVRLGSTQADTLCYPRPAPLPRTQPGWDWWNSSVRSTYLRCVRSESCSLWLVPSSATRGGWRIGPCTQQAIVTLLRLFHNSVYERTYSFLCLLCYNFEVS